MTQWESCTPVNIVPSRDYRDAGLPDKFREHREQLVFKPLALNPRFLKHALNPSRLKTDDIGTSLHAIKVDDHSIAGEIKITTYGRYAKGA